MGALKQRLPVSLSQRLNQIAPGATAKGRPDKAQNPAITGTYSQETAAIRAKHCTINRSL